MTLNESLDLVVAKTGVERYRYLCLEHPNETVRDKYSALMLAEADRIQNPPTYPPIMEQLANATGAATRVVTSIVMGQPVMASPEEQERRGAICLTCDKWDAMQRRCTLCGCQTDIKRRLAQESCPDNPPKW